MGGGDYISRSDQPVKQPNNPPDYHFPSLSQTHTHTPHMQKKRTRAQTLGQDEDLQALQKLARVAQVPLDVERDHGAGAVLLLLGEGVLRVGGQARVEHLADGRVRLQVLRDGLLGWWVGG